MSITHISDLIPDDKNFNRHTERGSSLVKKSLERLGFGRSILVDKNLKIIGGNLTTEEAGQLGFEEVIVVPSDGTKIIAVQRTDIDLDTPKGRELALADNRTSEVSLNLDTALIEEVFIDGPEIVEEYFFADEIGADNEDPSGYDLAGRVDTSDSWSVVIKCKDETDCQLLYDEQVGRGRECKIMR